MHVVPPVCCGIDGHAAQLTACVRQVGADGTLHTAWRDFGTTSAQLLACRTWRNEQGGPIVVLESTGVYWKPISHGLVETLEVVVANARSVRQRPGKKTDKADAAWLADLLAHGLVEPRFLPPPAIQAWRDLTRTRVALVQTRTQGHNRLSTVLADTNIKVAHAMSDLFGHSGRRMRKAWCQGERDPKQRAAWALGTLRRKMPELACGLDGPVHRAPRATDPRCTGTDGVLGAADCGPRRADPASDGALYAATGAAPKYSGRQGDHSARHHRRDRHGEASLWLGHARVVVGRRLAGQQRACGQTTAGTHAEGQSLSASGRGAVCVGGTEDANVFRADVSALRKSSGAEKSGHGSGPENLGDPLPSAVERDLL